MGSFADIDRQLADPPVEVEALLARVEELAAGVGNAAEPEPESFGGLPAEAMAYALEIGRGPLSVRSILQVHRVLVDGTGEPRAGLPADALRGLQLTELVARYEMAVSQRRHPPLLLAGVVVLDFAAIRPFETGSEQMARLLLARELLRHGYTVARHVALRASPTSASGVWPWVSSLLGLVADAYATCAIPARKSVRGGVEGRYRPRPATATTTHSSSGTPERRGRGWRGGSVR